MLAIVIPYYKRTYFHHTLGSLVNQTNKKFKVYVGDDASPENPAELITYYESKLDITYKRFNENLGNRSLIRHWERCINLTHDEEWLMLLGDDDVLGKFVIASWYEHLENFISRSNLIRFSSRIIFEKENKLSKIYRHPVWETAPESFFRKYKNQTRSSLSEYIFTKSVFRDHGFRDFPLGWHSDDMAWLDFSERLPIYTINDAVIYVRFSDISISGKTSNEEAKSLAKIYFYKNIIKKKLDRFPSEQKKVLLREFEISVLAMRPLHPSEWFLLLYIHLKMKDFNSLKGLVKRFMNNSL